MKKIRIALYKTPWKLMKKFIVNILISIRTLSKWSHIEIWEADGKPFTQWETRAGYCGGISTSGKFTTYSAVLPQDRVVINGTCWTSTMRGKDNGTVKRDASGVLDHPERWDYIEVEITDEQYATLVSWMNYCVKHNKGYSNWDVLKFISPIHFPDGKRFICSEFVNNGLCTIGVLFGCGIISPGAVAKKLTKMGFTINSL